MFRKKLKENWKSIICIIFIGILLLPMVYTIFYSLPSADDFSVAMHAKNSSMLFADSIRYANWRWYSWSGLWFYMLIEQLINPLHYFAIESMGYGVLMIVLFALFIGALFVAIVTAARKILGVNQNEKILIYILTFLFAFLNTNVYSEIFYWFVGSSYMMAMTLGLLTVTLTVRYFYCAESEGVRVTLLCIIGALACNFFQEAILPGMIYIILWTYFSLKEHRPLWKKTIPFWFMFVSGLVAVLAPGNYARYASYTSEVDLMGAFIETIKISVKIVKHMVQQPLFIALLIFGVYIGISHTTKILRGVYPVLSGGLSLAALVINVFPIALGYTGVSYFPTRLFFVLDFTLMVGMMVTSICFGMYLKSLQGYKAFEKPGHIEALLLGGLFLLLYSTLVYGQGISRLPWSQTVAASRDVKELHDAWQECLIAIRDSEERDVVVEVEKKYFDSPVLQLPRVTDDAENWKNRAVASIYDKESVVVSGKEE